MYYTHDPSDVTSDCDNRYLKSAPRCGPQKPPRNKYSHLDSEFINNYILYLTKSN
jgi:hypothetical protein